MRFIAQFDLKSDIDMPIDIEKHPFRWVDGDCILVIRNVTKKDDERLVTLRCNMEFESQGLDHAQRDFADRILSLLDIMSLVSHAIFTFERLHKIFDWSATLKVRSGLIFCYDPPEYSPDHVFDKKLIATANLLQQATMDSQILSALRWFRLGILADVSEDQFQKFWFALELLAQYKKGNQKVHDLCPRCQGALYCETCNTYPMHRPYQKQAIESIWREFAPDQLELFSIMNEARNAVLHGTSPSKIEATTGMPLHEMVDPLARVTWKGLIAEVAAALPKEERPYDLRLSVANTFVKWNLSAAVRVSTAIPLGPNGAPDIERFIGISTSFEG